MAAMYEVENSVGGTAYYGPSLREAMKWAVAGGWAGYVISRKGRRPVIRANGGLHLGEYGESISQLEERTDEYSWPKFTDD